MADAEDDLDVPKKSSMVPLIGAAVAALLVGAGAGFGAALLIPSGEAGAEELAEAAPEEPLEVERDGEVMTIDNPSAPHLHDLGKFTVNLRGGGGGRTLRMNVQVQTSKLHQFDVEDATPALRDTILTLSSDYTYGDVEGLDGKQRLKDDLLGAVVRVVDPETVDRMYFTEFVVN